MRKLLIITCLLFSALTLRAEDYFDLQHFTVIPDTITISNDYYYRGTFRITSDTFTARLDSAPSYTVIFTTLAATINLPTTISGTLTMLAGSIQPYSRTEAQLKAIDGGVGLNVYGDSTNNTIVLSTGGVGGFVSAVGGTPTGW